MPTSTSSIRLTSDQMDPGTRPDQNQKPEPELEIESISSTIYSAGMTGQRPTTSSASRNSPFLLPMGVQYVQVTLQAQVELPLFRRKMARRGVSHWRQDQSHEMNPERVLYYCTQAPLPRTSARSRADHIVRSEKDMPADGGLSRDLLYCISRRKMIRCLGFLDWEARRPTQLRGKSEQRRRRNEEETNPH